MDDHVILVTDDDAPVGVRRKQDAHVAGLLHRAFSVFVFDSSDRLLLQRRSLSKYHSGGLWSNTCCSHPRPGESTRAAAHRRLFEEMGFECPLRTAFSFVYRADVGDGLMEHEYDHVFTGRFDGEPAPDFDEVDDWRWIPVPALERELAETPGRFTFWFRVAFDELRSRGLA